MASSEAETSTDNRFEEGFRKLDSMESASMDYRQLAALVNSMKKHVSTAKRNVINKLTRRIKMHKEKCEEELSAKAQKSIDEIAIIKSMEMSRIAKFALANEETVDNLSRQGRVTPHLLSLTRLAEDKALKSFVLKWRSEHSDWRILANFLLSKNTSRHFKRSEQKRKITKDSLLVEKELVFKRFKMQMVDVPAADVNKPLVERTGKGKKFKKKGKEDVVKPSAEAEPNEMAKDSDMNDDGAGEDNPDDDDLYTFNIVDEDLSALNQEGQEVTPPQEDQLPPVDVKTKEIANKLFSFGATEPDRESSCSEDEPPREIAQVTSQPPSRPKATQSAPKTDTEKGPSVAKRSINNRKPKTKKVAGDKWIVEHSQTSTEVAPKTDTTPSEVSREVEEDNSTEMVKTVLDIEELANQNIDTISTDNTVVSVKPLARRKKSAFFLGGVDEIDESLGTSKEEQERARKNQKVAGYKGLRDREKKLLSSTFTESLKAGRPSKKKAARVGDGQDKFEHNQRQPDKFSKKSSKQTLKAGASGKQSRYEKGGAKTFTNKLPTKAPAEPAPESLHPSWQASRKRKEQLALIQNGPKAKKITFDD